MSVHLRFPALIAILALVVSGCGGDQESTDRARILAPQSPPAPGEYLAILDEGVDPQELAAEEGFTIIEYVEEMRLLRFTTAKKIHQLRAVGSLDAVETNEEVVISDPINLIAGFAEFDWDEPMYPSQAALQCLNLDEVHQHARGAGIKVSVIDTGVAVNHPHLSGRMQVVNHEILGYPWEFQPFNNTYEAFGHGSHVAGSILTVAPDAIIVPFRALPNRGTGTDFEVTVALFASLKAKVDIVNMSIRLSEDSDVVQEVLQILDDAGIIVVAAAGNETPNSDPVFPASDFRTIAVAATSPAAGETCEEIAPFSAMGADVDFATIGVMVRSSIPGGTFDDPWVKSATGTSVACAIASGSIALMLGDLEGVPVPADPLDKLRTSALPVRGGTVQAGRMSVYHALGLDQN